jgi:hypothetical protein
MPYPPNFSRFDTLDNIWWGVLIVILAVFAVVLPCWSLDSENEFEIGPRDLAAIQPISFSTFRFPFCGRTSHLCNTGWARLIQCCLTLPAFLGALCGALICGLPCNVRSWIHLRVLGIKNHFVLGSRRNWNRSITECFQNQHVKSVLECDIQFFTDAFFVMLCTTLAAVFNFCRNKHPVPTEAEAEWVSELVWTLCRREEWLLGIEPRIV